MVLWCLAMWYTNIAKYVAQHLISLFVLNKYWVFVFLCLQIEFYGGRIYSLHMDSQFIPFNKC